MSTNSKKTNVALWVGQIALAGMFLFAGGMKLVLPLSVFASQTPLPGIIIRLVGIAEVAGALGLLLPGLLKLRPSLTPLAAAGLVGIMIGAAAITLATPQPSGAVVPIVVGLIAALIGYERWQRVPLATSRA